MIFPIWQIFSLVTTQIQLVVMFHEYIVKIILITYFLSTKQILVDYVLKNPYIWLLSAAYFFVYVVRTGVNDWSISHMEGLLNGLLMLAVAAAGSLVNFSEKKEKLFSARPFQTRKLSNRFDWILKNPVSIILKSKLRMGKSKVAK